ncbi:MAG TPA: hypothetical protein VIN09_07820 [Chloroflexota bacterium]
MSNPHESEVRRAIERLGGAAKVADLVRDYQVLSLGPVTFAGFGGTLTVTCQTATWSIRLTDDGYELVPR